MKHKMVIVDDEPKIIRFIKANLLSLGYEVESFLSGTQLLENFDLHQPDLILLDVMMPEIDGFEVLERIRKFSDTPVILLTARSNAHDKVYGLNLGADDYLTKPFSLEELFARVNAVLRRTKPSVQEFCLLSEIVCESLKINLGQKRVWIGDEELKVTNIEFAILEMLAVNVDKVVAHEQILTSVWGAEYRDDVEYLRVAIARIRRKMKKGGNLDKLIVTYPGLGYMLKSKLE
ncbi:response regulator transcription factor [Peribacillus simplex]|uniref:response regulator transcription factor n=1 Tax=Peribacillus simplex TaxID=1478 RepID=UPI003670ECE1